MVVWRRLSCLSLLAVLALVVQVKGSSVLQPSELEIEFSTFLMMSNTASKTTFDEIQVVWGSREFDEQLCNEDVSVDLSPEQALNYTSELPTVLITPNSKGCYGFPFANTAMKLGFDAIIIQTSANSDLDTASVTPRSNTEKMPSNIAVYRISSSESLFDHQEQVFRIYLNASPNAWTSGALLYVCILLSAINVLLSVYKFYIGVFCLVHHFKNQGTIKDRGVAVLIIEILQCLTVFAAAGDPSNILGIHSVVAFIFLLNFGSLFSLLTTAIVADTLNVVMKASLMVSKKSKARLYIILGTILMCISTVVGILFTAIYLNDYYTTISGMTALIFAIYQLTVGYYFISSKYKIVKLISRKDTKSADQTMNKQSKRMAGLLSNSAVFMILNTFGFLFGGVCLAFGAFSVFIFISVLGFLALSATGIAQIMSLRTYQDAFLSSKSNATASKSNSA